MVLHGQFPVGLLQAVIVCSGGNSQQIVEFGLLHHCFMLVSLLLRLFVIDLIFTMWAAVEFLSLVEVN